MRLNFKKLAFLGFVLVLLCSITNAFALSGWLDDYAGTGFSDVGAYSVDSFVNDDSTFYVQHQNTHISDPTNMVQPTCIISAMKKGWLGYSKQGSKTVTGYNPQIISFSVSSGTYKLYFASNSKYTIDFNGSIYDNN